LIITHEEEEMLVNHRNIGLKPEQLCKISLEGRRSCSVPYISAQQ